MRKLPLLAAMAALSLAGWGQNILTLEVENERVTASDLARVIPPWGQVPAATEVLCSPLPGWSRDLGRAELERLAWRNGLVDPGGEGQPERLRIRRRQRPLERQEAEAAMAVSVARRYRLPPEDVAVELLQYAAPMVPTGALEFGALGALPHPSQATPLPLTWRTREKRSGTVWLRARLQVRGTMAVAARALEAQSLLAEGDIVFEEGIFPFPPDRWGLAPADVAGKRLSRPVAAREKISRSLLVSFPAIERGALVQLRLSSGAIQLQAPGRAEQAGSIGERLPFRNLETGRRVFARLLDPQRAEVVEDLLVRAPNSRERGRP